MEFKDKFKQGLMQAPNRKSTPPDEIPAELWGIVLMPNWLQPGARFPFGLSAQHEQVRAEGASECVNFVAHHISEAVPVSPQYFLEFVRFEFGFECGFEYDVRIWASI